MTPQNLIKGVLLDAGGVLYLNKDGNAQLNDRIVDFVRANQNRLKFGLISDTEYDLKNVLKITGIPDLFEHVLTSESTGLQKTDPKIYIEAANKMGMEPQEILFVDNSQDFLETAKKAGLKTILYTSITDCLEKLENISHEG